MLILNPLLKHDILVFGNYQESLMNRKNIIYLKLNIINVFIVTFDQFNATLLNKSITSICFPVSP